MMNIIKILCIVLIASTLFGSPLTTPVFTYKDGYISLVANQNNGFDKHLYIDGNATSSSIGWITFPQIDSLVTRNIESAELWLSLASIKNNGTVSVYPLLEPIQSTENSVEVSSLKYDTTLIGKIDINSTTSTKTIFPIDIKDLVESSSFYGVVLVSTDSAQVLFNAKESNMGTMVYITQKITNSDARWTSGNVIPQKNTGSLGDFFLHNTTNTVYKKEATGWTKQYSIEGPQGLQGAIGPQGADGAAGEPGKKGAPGVDITWRGIWDNTTQYNVYDGVSSNGSVYLALEASSGIAPHSDTTKWKLSARGGAQGNQGAPGKDGETVMWVGVWNDTNSYETNDAVIYDGSAYRALQPSKGVSPTTGDYWELSIGKASQGLIGDKGAKGDKGETGEIGIVGVNAIWHGQWNNTTNYALGSIVYHQGNSYYALKPSLDKTPSPTSDYWQVSIRGGSTGDKGDIGNNGPAGLKGAASPWSKNGSELTVAKDVIAQKYNFNSSKKYYYHISPTDFLPESKTPYDSKHGFYITDKDWTHVSAPVHLPHQATITKVTLYVYNNTDRKPSIDLDVRYLRAASNSGELARFSIETQSTEIQKLTIDNINRPIINDKNAYYFKMYEYWDGTDNIKIYGALIEYTLPGLE